MTHKNQNKTTILTLRATKFEIENATEFTSGFNLRLAEVLVILFILMLWLLSLLKFMQHFNKIRITHYREIPYKYFLKDPENLSQVRVCRYPSQGVIFTNDPVALVSQTRQYSMCSDLLMTPKHSLTIRANSQDDSLMKQKRFSKLNMVRSIVISEVDDEINNKSIISEKNKGSNDTMNYIDNDESMYLQQNSNPTPPSSSPPPPPQPLLPTTRSKIQIHHLDDSNLNESIYHRTVDQRRRLFRNSILVNRKHFIDHLSVSPIIKKSIIDLHRRSIENIEHRARMLNNPSISLNNQKQQQINNQSQNQKHKNHHQCNKPKLDKRKSFLYEIKIKPEKFRSRFSDSSTRESNSITNKVGSTESCV